MAHYLRFLAGEEREDGLHVDDRTRNALRERGLVDVNGSGFWQLTPRGRVVVEDELGRGDDDDFVPQYEPWRHGGWYVVNVRYPTGAIGCVSRNYPDGKWRIVCGRPHDETFPTRDAAARAERRVTLATTETAVTS